MKKIFTTAFLLCCLLSTYAAKVNKFFNVKVGSETRKYLLYVPDNVVEDAPLVISLHGAGGTVSTSSHDPDFNAIADKDGFIVAYPQGKNTVFPGLGGMEAPGWTSTGEENFDTNFLKAVVEDVAGKYTIDRNRLYCCGFSNGGMMTYVMANTSSDIFAAFAAISGYPINEFHLHHTSSRPVPFLHIHGKADDFVRYSLVPNVIDNMVARNGANPVSKKIKKTNNDGTYTKSVYEAGEGGFPIIFYEIDGMGHSPFTNLTEDKSSTLTMWNFFQQYTLDSPCDPTMKWRPRIETEKYKPENHGWTINNGTTLLQFGGAQNTDANQNVYRSLQLRTGLYKLCFTSEGDAEKTIGVKIEKLTGKKNAVLDATVQVGTDADLRFEVTDGWGEYKITFTRPSEDDVISVSNIGIYSVIDNEETGIYENEKMRNGENENSQRSKIYDLQGRQVHPQFSAQPFGDADYRQGAIVPNARLKRGIYIINGKKIVK